MMEGMMKVYWYAPEQVKRMQSIWNTNYTERNMLEFFDTKENIDIFQIAFFSISIALLIFFIIFLIFFRCENGVRKYLMQHVIFFYKQLWYNII